MNELKLVIFIAISLLPNLLSLSCPLSKKVSNLLNCSVQERIKGGNVRERSHLHSLT